MLPSVKESAEKGIFESENATTLFCGGVDHSNSSSIWSLIGGVFCFGTPEEVDCDTMPNNFNNINPTSTSSKKSKVLHSINIIIILIIIIIIIIIIILIKEKEYKKYMEI